MKQSRLRAALMSLLSLGFIATFAVGCGDSRDNFVAANNNGIGVGNLVFRFVRAQTVDTVPAGTTTLRFDLYAGSPPSAANFVETRTVAYADVVTLTDVPANVTTVVVTAFGADNTPLVTLQGDAPVAEGGTVEVDLNDAVPVTFDAITVSPDPANLIVTDQMQPETLQLTITGTFSNGSVVDLPINNVTTTFTLANPNALNISDTGVMSDTKHGDNTSVTAMYTIGSTTLSDTFSAHSFGFFAVALGATSLTPTGDYTAGYSVGFEDDNNTGAIEVTQTATTTYSFGNPAPTGLTIDPATGQMTSTGTTPTGAFTVVVTWVDNVRTGASGLTFTDVIPFDVAEELMN